MLITADATSYTPAPSLPFRYNFPSYIQPAAPPKCPPGQFYSGTCVQWSKSNAQVCVKWSGRCGPPPQ
jgi:hypothetical protein